MGKFYKIERQVELNTGDKFMYLIDDEEIGEAVCLECWTDSVHAMDLDMKEKVEIRAKDLICKL